MTTTRFRLDSPIMVGPDRFWVGEQCWLIINLFSGQTALATEMWVRDAKRKGWLE